MIRVRHGQIQEGWGGGGGEGGPQRCPGSNTLL